MLEFSAFEEDFAGGQGDLLEFFNWDWVGVLDCLNSVFDLEEQIVYSLVKL